MPMGDEGSAEKSNVAGAPRTALFAGAVMVTVGGV